MSASDWPEVCSGGRGVKGWWGRPAEQRSAKRLFLKTSPRANPRAGWAPGVPQDMASRSDWRGPAGMLSLRVSNSAEGQGTRDTPRGFAFPHLAELNVGQRFKILRPGPGRRWKAAGALPPACQPPGAAEAAGLRAGQFRTSSRNKRLVSLAREALRARLHPSRAVEPCTAGPPCGMQEGSISQIPRREDPRVEKRRVFSA